MRPSLYTEGFAVPGDDSIIDVRDPLTGLSVVCGETLTQVQTRYPGAVVMNLDQWAAEKAARQRTPITWRECSEARYDEMLNVLPPAVYGRGGFLVGEPFDHEADTGHARFAAFRQTPLGYFESNRPLTRAEFRREIGRA